MGWVCAIGATVIPGALDNYDELIAKFRVLARIESPSQAPGYRYYLAAALARGRRPAEAIIELEELGRFVEEHGAYWHFHTHLQKCFLALCYDTIGRADDARRMFDSAEQEISQGTMHRLRWVGRLLTQLLRDEVGTLLNTEGARGAISDRQKAILRCYTTWLESDHGPRPLSPASGLPGHLREVPARIIHALLADGEYVHAEAMAREWLSALLTAETMTGSTVPPWLTYWARALLGLSLAGREEYGEAETELLAAWDGLQRHKGVIPGDAMPCLDETLDGLVEVCERTGRPDEAAAWRAQRSQ